MIAESVAAQFDVPGRLVAIQPIRTGNVNDTYTAIFRTTYSEERFILQRINGAVFPDPPKVMSNVKRVTEHAHRRIEAEFDQADRIWQLPRVIPSRDGVDYVVDDDGGHWRGLSLIASATSHDTIKDLDHAQEAGIVLGHFQGLISDLDPGLLDDTLPDFHITPKYLECFDRAVDSDSGRERLTASTEARRIESFINERRAFAGVLENARVAGELPLRPVHGDPKISNIMIDDLTGKGTCIVDLDTVKPGLIHYDFGDAVRSCCNPVGEETDDLASVGIDLDLFGAIVRGYLREANGFLSEADQGYLFDSTRLLAFELGIRFFADYLAGDIYFKTSYAGQNLNRARVQLRLCESIEANEAPMRRILEGARIRSGEFV